MLGTYKAIPTYGYLPIPTAAWNHMHCQLKAGFNWKCNRN
jgi:hypothetical protein